MTAVEWLIDKIFGEHTEAWQKEIQQALEMEKKQILQDQQVQKGDYCAVCGCREFWNDEEE